MLCRDWEISPIAFKSEKECLIIINDELSGETNRIKFHSVGCVSIIHYPVSHITTIREITKIKTLSLPASDESLGGLLDIFFCCIRRNTKEGSVCINT